MSATVEIGYDVRHWVTFGIKDATPEELATLSKDDRESMLLARRLHEAGRLVELTEHAEDNPTIFEVDHSSIIEVDEDTEWEVTR